MRHITFALVLVGAVLLAGTSRAHKNEISPEAVRELVAKGELLPLEEILRRNESAVVGRIIEIELESKSTGYVYEIKVLRSDGRKFEIKVNGRTGELISGRR